MSHIGLCIFCNAQILTYLHHWLLASIEQVVVIADLEFQAEGL